MDAAAAAGDGQIVWRRVVADTETPVSAMLKLIEPGRGDFLLESVEGGAVRGRYSLIGLDPDLVWRATGDDSEINRRWRSDRAAFEPCTGDTLAELRAARRRVPPAGPGRPAAGAAALVGTMGTTPRAWPSACRSRGTIRSACPTCCSSGRRCCWSSTG